MSNRAISIVSGVAFILAASGSAFAADLARQMPVKAPPPAPPVPVWNWTGFYVGANAGYTWSDHGVDLSPTSGDVPALISSTGQVPGSINLKRDGFIGGGQIGYNWQFTNWLVGLEADVQGTSVNNTALVHTAVPGMFPVDNTVSSKLEALGTVRGRIGFLPHTNWLIFVTGGLAYGEVKNSATIFDFLPLSFSGNSSEWKTGWTLGGGTEWAFARNWSAKVEYLYYDLGKTTVTLSRVVGDPAFGGTFAARFTNNGHIARAGINYHF
jgi:outer membrane immunogenic protein